MGAGATRASSTTRKRSFAASTPSPARCRRSWPARPRRSRRNSKSSATSGKPPSEDAEEPARIGKIEDRLDAIEDKRGADVWTPAQLAMAGAVLTIGNDGKAHIERGLVRPEDMPKKSRTRPRPRTTTAATETEEDQSPALSAALIESLTAHRSAALAAELQQRPDIALAAVVHAFASRILRDGLAEGSSLQVTASAQSLRRVEGSKALHAD